MDIDRIKGFVECRWQNTIIPTLKKFITIPNKSPLFDQDWARHGYMDQAVNLLMTWCQQQNIPGMQFEVLRLENRTPLIYIEIPGQIDNIVLLYGHLDKQPEMTGWRDNLGPWQPVLEGDKLYGRGAADDGYALFAALTAIHALTEQHIPHARCIILIEACEESGSDDLPYYMQALADKIKTPELVIGLDSGCGNYEQLWSTTSLRGIVAGDLTVKVLTEGVHSGNASGIVPSSFRIVRALLSRIEEEATGKILINALHVNIPAERIEQAKMAAQHLKEEVYRGFPFIHNTKPLDQPLEELILNRTWRPTLSYIGADGLPPLEAAGNVLRPYTTLKLSFRIPPHIDPQQAFSAIKKTLETSTPQGADVSFTLNSVAKGWEAPTKTAWLSDATNAASRHFFGKDYMCMGEGGTIPFMSMLGEQFPEAQFLITGVLGPHSNAHGPNEFLHIPTAKKLTCCISYVLAQHYKAMNG